MIIEHRSMQWRVCFVSLLVTTAAAGCQEPNPRSCIDGTCTDPSLPFCDVDGALAGEPETCIAVECAPGELAGCRGDQAITCNSVGTNYDLVRCERGCDASAGGCRLCEPSQTVCANGMVQTCDASGAVIASESCPLGCFEDQPRCRELVPSNGLAMYLDAATMAPDLDLSAGGRIDTATGLVLDSQSTQLAVTTVLLPAPTDGAPIRVLVAGSVRLGDVQIESTVYPGPALAILAREEISVEGDLLLWGNDYQNAYPFPGGVSIPGCDGEPGGDRTTSDAQLWSGGGGSGHATAGGRGGEIEFMLSGGTAGAPGGSPTLEPLRGGCGGYLGGGALQLTSRKAIRLRENSVINANGKLGTAYFGGPEPLVGGGAGGGILLEGPVVVLDESAKLVVNGGPAATEEMLAPPTSVTRAPSTGGTCTSTTTYRCGNGGDGAGADGPATDGQSVPYTSSTSVMVFKAAGGGGGLGYIRINTQTGTYSKASDVVESGVVTTSTLRTR